MPAKAGRNRKWGGKSATSSGVASNVAEVDIDIEVDPSWCDIASIGDPERYARFAPPPAFLNDMVCNREHWAGDIGMPVVRAIAKAIHTTCLPWQVDWASWRKHAADFFDRLCSHRAARARRTDERLATLLQRTDELRDALNQNVVHLRGRIEAVEQSVSRFELQASLQKPALAPVVHENVRSSVLRAQLRAVASRSPEPRRELVRLAEEVEEIATSQA